jgi:hypothetical protein
MYFVPEGQHDISLAPHTEAISISNTVSTMTGVPMGATVHAVHDADVSRLRTEKLDKEVRGTVGNGGVLNKFLRCQ